MRRSATVAGSATAGNVATTMRTALSDTGQRRAPVTDSRAAGQPDRPLDEVVARGRQGSVTPTRTMSRGQVDSPVRAPFR